MKPDPEDLIDATKEDVNAILLDIRKSFENKIKNFEKSLKRVDEMIEIKQHDNDILVNYIFKVCRVQRTDNLQEKGLGSLYNFF